MGAGGGPVVGADGADRRALGRFEGAVARDLGFVFCHLRVLRSPGSTLFPYTTLFRSFEQARDVGLVLEGGADEARGGSLGGRDRRPGRGHVDGLGFALGGDRAVVVVTGVGGGPVVDAAGADRRALGRFCGVVASALGFVFGQWRAVALTAVVELPALRVALPI